MKLAVEGRETYAYTGGRPFDAAAPCLVFVHGACNDHSVWTLLARWFAHHGFGVLAVDLPGHGRSAGPPPASIEDAAGWLLVLLDAAGVDRAAFAGHSMGSLIALEAAARAPARSTHLLMLATACPMKVPDTLLALARDRPLEAIDRVTAFSISTVAAKPSFPAPGAWLHGSNRALMRRLQNAAARSQGINLFEHDFQVCDRYGRGLQAAAGVRAPATLILGQRDQMTLPKATTELAARLQASVTVLPGGHQLMGEQPDGVLAALRRALAA